jgi:DNA-binding ferritin-like protein
MKRAYKILLDHLNEEILINTRLADLYYKDMENALEIHDHVTALMYEKYLRKLRDENYELRIAVRIIEERVT